MVAKNRFSALSEDEDSKRIVSSEPLKENKYTDDESNTHCIKQDKATNTTENDLKLIIPREEKIQMTKLGTSIRVDLKNKLDKHAKNYSRTTNNLVNIIFDNLYNEKNKKFDITLEKKESFKITSYHIKKDHFKAIEKLSKSTGYNKSEIFNILITEGLNRL